MSGNRAGRGRVVLALCVLTAFAAGAGTACRDDGGNGAASATTGTTAAEAQAAGTLLVLADDSLAEAFTDLSADFEREFPDADVVLDFGGSTDLAVRVAAGEPADVFVAAGTAGIALVTDAGVVGAPRTIARNRPAIAVGRGNPNDVDTIADLADPSVHVALCVPSEACGVVAATALAKAGVPTPAATLEPSVKAVMTKVVLGEVTAGIAYASDVLAAGDDVVGVPLEGPLATDADLDVPYPLVLVEPVANRALAEAWVAYLLGRRGQDTLRARGFLEP